MNLYIFVGGIQETTITVVYLWMQSGKASSVEDDYEPS